MNIRLHKVAQTSVGCGVAGRFIELQTGEQLSQRRRGRARGQRAVDPTWIEIVRPSRRQPTPNTVTTTFALCGAFGLPQ